jgi:hypothetical protein
MLRRLVPARTVAGGSRRCSASSATRRWGVLFRLAYLGVTNTFALLRLLPRSDRDKDAEILALRHQIMVLQRHLYGERVQFTRQRPTAAPATRPDHRTCHADTSQRPPTRPTWRAPPRIRSCGLANADGIFGTRSGAGVAFGPVPPDPPMARATDARGARVPSACYSLDNRSWSVGSTSTKTSNWPQPRCRRRGFGAVNQLRQTWRGRATRSMRTAATAGRPGDPRLPVT